MTVTLIRPPVLYPKKRPNASAHPLPPLGLAYLAGALRSHGCKVTCIDASGEALDRVRECALDSTMLEYGLSVQEILARIPAATRVIGVSCMFSYDWFYGLELIRAIRARFPSAFLVLGGEHITADHEYILKTMPEVDACVLGEGEYKFMGLMDALSEGVQKRELPGVAYWDAESRTVRKNDAKDGHYRVQDVDSIPRPAWDLLPLRSYLDAGYGYASVHYRAMPMMASRGCPHKCTFCSSPQMWTTRYKSREVGDVIDEIKTYIREYGINRVEFYDLTAIVDKRWITEFCQRLISENLGLTWSMPSGTRTEALSQEVLELVKKSGCSKLVYPLESGNPRVSGAINKKINFKNFLASARQAVKAGIIVKMNVIIGFPFQSYWDVFLEHLFMIRLAWIGVRDVAFYNFAPYPGSELHAGLVAEGRIVKDENYPKTLKRIYMANFANTVSWSPRMTGRNLMILSLTGMATFYGFQFLFRPHRVVTATYRIFTGQPLTALELVLRGALVRAKLAHLSKLKRIYEPRHADSPAAARP